MTAKKVTMDYLKQIVNSQQQSAPANTTSEPMEHSSQAADWLWQQMSEIYGETWTREHGERPSIIWKAALNKQSQSEVKHAVAEVVNQAITWPPNLPKFIELCQGPQIDTDEAFNRMIAKKPCNGVAEFETRQECSFRCKKQLPEDKARALFKKVLIRNIQRVKSGELPERDINPVQIASPEVFRHAETLEMRNSRLDAEIAIMQASGTRLIGPYRKRFNETKGE